MASGIHQLEHGTLMSDEKRQDVRIAAAWTCKIHYPNGTAENGKVRNVSVRGAQIETIIELKKGERVVVEISAMHQGNRQTLRAVAQASYGVLSGDVRRVGVFFVSLSTEDQAFLQSYIDAKSPDSE